MKGKHPFFSRKLHLIKSDFFHLLIVSGIVMLVFISEACTPLPPPSLTTADRKELDTLYRQEVELLAPYLDSICTVQFDSLKEIVIDSLLQERIRERDELLKRYKNKETRI
ncbi:MAG: hypothetical protein GY705_04410 [Bacteroidetes bacterium]|nr:hypothetical protein [Bacteroidota bacterium]